MVNTVWEHTMNDSLQTAARALLALIETVLLLVAVPLVIGAAVAYGLLICARAARVGMREARCAKQAAPLLASQCD
jgi:hypothetical protein